MKLSASVVDEQEDENRMFSKDALKELFRLYEGTASDTHDVYKSVYSLVLHPELVATFDSY